MIMQSFRSSSSATTPAPWYPFLRWDGPGAPSNPPDRPPLVLLLLPWLPRIGDDPTKFALCVEGDPKNVVELWL